MRLIDYSQLSTDRLDEIRSIVEGHESLGEVLAWLQSEVSPKRLRELLTRLVVQDEFSMDLVIPRTDGVVLVYDTS